MKRSLVHRFSLSFLVSFALMLTAIAKASSQSAQEVKPGNAIVQNEQDVRLLEVGKPVGREIKGGETHAYRVLLTAGQFLHAAVDQHRIDVVVTLFGPDNIQIAVGSPNGSEESEHVWAIAENSGSYRLEVHSLEKDAKLGRYEARIEELRIASEKDKDLVDKHEAIEYLKLTSLLSRAAGDGAGAAAKLNIIGLLYNSLGEKQRALEYLNRALSLSHAVGDRQGEVTALNNIGSVHNSMGEKNKALESLNRALSLSEIADDRSGEATSLNNIGGVYNSLGNKKKALEYYNRALQILQALGDHVGEARALNNIGAVYSSEGDKQKALEYYNRALPIFRKTIDRSGEAMTLSNIGQVYSTLGEMQKALESLNQALPLSRAEGDLLAEASTLHNIGSVYYSLGEKQRTFEYYNQALLIFRALRDRQDEAKTLNNMGGVQDSFGQKQKALEYYNQALAISREVGGRLAEATTLSNIGGVYADLGDKQKALDYLNQALPILRAVGDRSGEATALDNIGFTYYSMSKVEEALDYYVQAIAKHESLRASATIEEIKTDLSDRSASVYRRALLLLMQLSRQTEAFDLTERARARVFLDQISNVRPRQRGTGTTQLIGEEQTLASELNALEQRLKQERSRPALSLSTDVTSSLEKELAGKQHQYEDLLLRLKLSNPEYASLRSVETLTLSEIQKLLDNDTTLLSYFVTLEKTLAFVVTRGSFRAVELPVKEEELTSSINWFRGFSSLRNPRPETLKQLHAWLIAPLSQYIKSPTVGIIPHGVLNYFPFAALTDGQHFFGEEHNIFYLPSASVLPFILSKSKFPGTQMLAVAQSRAEGLPVLQYADEEAQAVASLYNTQAVTTEKASKSGFLKQAGEYSIIHLAAHAELNSFSPLFSRIVLGMDKQDKGSGSALEVREVYDLDLSKSSLVVLSACETQLGQQSKGDDIVALNRAFIYAGAPTVIASLWAVDDESTSYLMKSFYTHLKNGTSKAEALRFAQSDTRKKYSHPYYWAGFVLTGDPGQRAKR